MRRAISSFWILGLLLVVTTARPTLADPTAPIGCDGNWHRLETVNPGHDGGDFNSLASVDAVSSTDVWAVGVGDDFDAPQPGYRTLIEHFDGVGWTWVPSPNSPRSTWNVLAGVSASGPDDVWAVGSLNTSPYYSLIEHWDGTGWRIAQSGTPNTYLTSVVALAPNDVWAAGSTNYVGQGLLVHWDGSTWARVELPEAIVFRAITALGPDDIWAVGQESTAQFLDLTAAYHYDGSSWTRVPTPSPLRIHQEDENWLTSVATVSPDDVWATGVARDHDWGIMDHPFTIHWDGSVWHVVHTPDPGGQQADTDLWASVGFGSNDVWAVGSQGSEPDWRTFTVHWDGSAWTELPSTTNGRFLGLAADETGALWGVGDASVNHPFRGTATLGEHRC
jgi:hypothetical protein